MGYVVDFRGRPACPCLAEWLPVYERALLLRGVIKASLDIYQLIGGAAASGGTHAEGGAADTGQTSDEAIYVARQMGADACWHRPFNWDSDGGMEHTHLVLRGCPHNGPARYQIAAVDAGFNGLGAGGQQAPDDGPRPLSHRTWREGIAWAHQQEADMPLSKDDLAEVRAVVREELAAALRFESPDGKHKWGLGQWVKSIYNRTKPEVKP